jgi:hypothetical protein
MTAPDPKLTLTEATAPAVAAREPKLSLSEALAPYLPGARRAQVRDTLAARYGADLVTEDMIDAAIDGRRPPAGPGAVHRAWAESLDGPALADRLTRLAGDVRWCSPPERAAVLAEAAARVGPGRASQGQARLEREIRDTAAALSNGLTMRADRPSYGYTKTHLRDQLAQLTGMITGHLIASGAWDKPGAPGLAAVEHAKAVFGLDLHGLARAIKESR